MTASEGTNVMTADPAKLRQIAHDYAKAWSSKSPAAVASFFAPNARMVINRGDALNGQAEIAEMAKGFYTAFPDLVVHCDALRTAGDHAVFVWTLDGHHVETKNRVQVGGWEEWNFDESLKIESSLGWFDSAEYARQIAEGASEPS